jgi:hypothetical protein
MAPKRNHAAYYLVPLAYLLLGVYGFAQTGLPPYRQPGQITQGQGPKPTTAPTPPTTPPAPAATPQPPPQTAPSLLDHPAQPAKINLDSGKLTVQADNSSLSEILHQVAQSSGMKIEGLDAGGSADQRIFGSYGPGAPRDVLSELLDGSGYNVMMLGATPSGAPRELALTLRSAAGTTVAQPQQTSAQSEDSDEDVEPTQYPEAQQEPPARPEVRNGARTPQQILQDLQRMRTQEQQQQQDQQPQ